MNSLYLLLFAPLFSCTAYNKTDQQPGITDGTLYTPAAYFPEPKHDSAIGDRIVAFAVTQLDAPYRYCSMDPTNGFDCSGFINYVFNHFHISVPRPSVEFTNLGTTIKLDKARPGDLILFTGTNPRKRVVGHIGIIYSNIDGEIRFIHSSSGEANGVTITPLNNLYLARFVKAIRILE